MKMLTVAAAAVIATSVAAQPAGQWPLAKSAPVIAKTQTVTLSPDVSRLTAGERRAVEKLVEVGHIFQRLYEQQRHQDARASLAALEQLHRRSPSPATKNLLDLYRLNQGPIATTLENQREPFLAVAMKPPGGNVWPWGITKAEVDAYLAANPGQSDAILHPRTVVRRATAENLRRDLAELTQHPGLDLLHPGLKARLTTLARTPNSKTLYAVPY